MSYLKTKKNSCNCPTTLLPQPDLFVSKSYQRVTIVSVDMIVTLINGWAGSKKIYRFLPVFDVLLKWLLNQIMSYCKVKHTICMNKYRLPYTISGVTRCISICSTITLSGEIFVGRNYSSCKIFVNKRKVRPFLSGLQLE